MRFNLQIKLLFWICLVVILVLLIFMIQTLFREREILQASFQKRAIVLAKILESSIASREELKDTQKLQAQIYKVMWLDPEIVGIAVTIPSEEGLKIVASNDVTEIGKMADPENIVSYEKNTILTKTSTLPDGTLILRTFAPIHVGGQIVGTYDIKLSLETEEKTIAKQQREFILMLSLTIFVLIFSLFLLLKKIIINPIVEIKKGLEKIGSGKLDYRIIPRSNDEIGDLALGLNEMAEKLEKTYETLEEKVRERTAELEELKTSLEIRVQARTRELKELAESLEEKVKERTKELQKKIEELEKFQKMAIGRELKMVELKEEIKRLKEELEKYKHG